MMTERFDKYLSVELQNLSSRHWSNSEIVATVTKFLCYKKGARILDIGSGVGKFCVLGAKQNPGANFTGVEKRKNLVDVANKQKILLNTPNCEFVHADVRKISFQDFDGIYFFNSFLEYIDETASIDYTSVFSRYEYIELCEYLFNEFAAARPGTRIVTYYAPAGIIPNSYRLISTSNSRLIKCYVKDGVEFNELFDRKVIEKHIALIQN